VLCRWRCWVCEGGACAARTPDASLTEALATWDLERFTASTAAAGAQIMTPAAVSARSGCSPLATPIWPQRPATMPFAGSNGPERIVDAVAKVLAP
jgi:hypothetical protein